VNNLIESLKNLDRTNIWYLHDQELFFSTRDSFFEYFYNIENPYQMGSFICTIENTKYILQIEPWLPGCLNLSNNTSKDDLNSMIYKNYKNYHKYRMKGYGINIEPDEIEYLPIKVKGTFLNSMYCLGFSYALYQIKGD
jgi:hypothetical protein